ncbi:MAG TPA: hypothetical protein VFE47_23955 [Tepidisphaeraceae bacterium]|nr:hypothetical protein [Tepidisphaeraceae bacterium]
MLAQSALIARRGVVALFAVLSCFVAGGCMTSYATPGHGADLKALGATTRQSLTDASINDTLAKKPLAQFPCSIAAVRIQAPGYSSESADTYGTGNYCVITTRDVESDSDFGKIAKLPLVIGVAPVNRLLLPTQLNSDLELRQAAAALHADMLLIYTIDTKFEVEDHLSPMTIATLGLSPTMTAQVVTTASAVLLDTRNGYLYGYTEATEKGAQLTNGWMTEAAVNDARKRTEAKAFGKLVDGLQGTWVGVVKNFATPKLSSDTDSHSITAARD